MIRFFPETLPRIAERSSSFARTLRSRKYKPGANPSTRWTKRARCVWASHGRVMKGIRRGTGSLSRSISKKEERGMEVTPSMATAWRLWWMICRNPAWRHAGRVTSGEPLHASAPSSCLIGKISCGKVEFSAPGVLAAAMVGAGAIPAERTASCSDGCVNVR